MPARGKTYRLTPRAEADLEEIWLYTFKHWSAEQADSYLAAIITAFSQLATGKASGRPVDIRDGYFKYPAGSHFIFYRLAATGLVVIRILHQRMDVERHL